MINKEDNNTDLKNLDSDSLQKLIKHFNIIAGILFFASATEVALLIDSFFVKGNYKGLESIPTNERLLIVFILIQIFSIFSISYIKRKCEKLSQKTKDI